MPVFAVNAFIELNSMHQKAHRNRPLHPGVAVLVFIRHPQVPKRLEDKGVLEGLRLLEDDSLGGGGSRGSGRVSFSKLRLVWRGKNHYATGAPEKEVGAGATLASIQTAVTDSAFAFLREE